MASRGKLASSELAPRLNAVVNANAVVMSYCKAIIQQENITVSALKNLPAHQELATMHAFNWQQDVQPRIQLCLAHTAIFSNAFLGDYADRLKALIDEMQHGNQLAKDHFKATIAYLTMKLSDVVGICRDATAAVEQFRQILEQDTNNFRSDSDEAQTKIGALEATESNLEDKYRALVLEEVLVVPVLLSTGTDLRKDKDARFGAERQLARQRQELVALNVAKSQIDGFLGAMGPASSAVASLEAAWVSLKSDFDEVTGELQKLSATSAAAWLAPLLETAKKDWQVALDKARQLQSSIN